jgi:hydrogenase nickel incorporation protein HypA/HybF
MHELSLTQSVVDICVGKAQGRRVTAVVLEIGTLSGVVPDAMAFCFDACSRDTLLEGAEFRIETVAAMARCGDCDREFPLAAHFDPCPGCGGFRLQLLAGEELRVKYLEVE